MLPHLYLLERQALQRLFDSIGPSLINPNSRRNTLIIEKDDEEDDDEPSNDLDGERIQATVDFKAIFSVVYYFQYLSD